MSRNRDDQLPPIREALDPIATPYLSSISSTVSGNFSIAKEVLMGSFQSEHRRSESTRILSDRESPSTPFVLAAQGLN
jgi:division protein 1